MPTHTLTRRIERRGKDLIDQIDALHLRGALVAMHSFLEKLPQTKKLNEAGLRACNKACDVRNALRALLEEHDAGRLTLAEFGGWEPLGLSSPSLKASKSGSEVAA